MNVLGRIFLNSHKDRDVERTLGVNFFGMNKFVEGRRDWVAGLRFGVRMSSTGHIDLN